MYAQEFEVKSCPTIGPVTAHEGMVVEGYASLFGARDKGGDVVMPGAYAGSLQAMVNKGERVRMLWQHDPSQPIGVWDDVYEDAKGLRVKGRLLPDVARAQEAASLLASGAIDGLSIGYRTKRAEKGADGTRRLVEVELWEVSLVTFPMLAEARVGTKSDGPTWQDLAAQIEAATADLIALRSDP